MSADDRSHRLRLPRSRVLTCDVLHYHRKVPTCAHDRICDLGAIADARAGCPHRISWTMLFTKAYGIVAREYPVLRQNWFSLPWPHLYQHRRTVAMLAVQRVYRGEPWLFWGRFNKPEDKSLVDLQRRLTHYRDDPVKEVFRHQLRLSSLPTPLRRLVWFSGLNLSGRVRARHLGTAFLTTLAGQGVEIPNPPAFLTGNFTYGPLDDDNQSRVTLAYDHRLTDGLQIAKILRRLEQVLNGEIATELREITDQYRLRIVA